MQRVCKSTKRGDAFCKTAPHGEGYAGLINYFNFCVFRRFLEGLIPMDVCPLPYGKKLWDGTDGFLDLW